MQTFKKKRKDDRFCVIKHAESLLNPSNAAAADTLNQAVNNHPHPPPILFFPPVESVLDTDRRHSIGACAAAHHKHSIFMVTLHQLRPGLCFSDVATITCQSCLQRTRP